MKIVIISDTHLPKRAKGLPARLTAELKDADLIIHAGDWQTIDVFHELHTYGKVEGVFGNVDDEEIKKHFPEKRIIELNGFKIGVTHGHGKGKTTEKRAILAFTEDEVDCIIFGHSHIPLKKYQNGLLLFNPGSPTDKRRQKMYSFGILQIGDTIEADHIFFSNKGVTNE
ncbi:metallophosphoesterase family protein [Bacillus sp. USDA818B3_A]|uniref:metallophosphoesterase family protein n=1 Tax=Bacillus sp. USDA818B3_A TaxID=2698834 RepID=UPI00136E68B1|nr:metallophosphoesterase [Bacillus sp. USDA818B3_A]